MLELTKLTKERNRPKQADRQTERSKADRKNNNIRVNVTRSQ